MLRKAISMCLGKRHCKKGLMKRLSSFVLTVVFLLCSLLPLILSPEPVLADDDYTILDYFGCSITPREQLSKHTHDHYYLTTEYTRYNGSDLYCSTPNGWDERGGHMNCTGFAMAVIRDCGGKFPFSGYCLGTNVYRHLNAGGVKAYIFNTCYEARKSGILEKGDMLWYRPLSKGDCHWAVFWHGSTHWASEGAGNHFSKMHAYADVYRVYVYKAQPKRGYLRIKFRPKDKKTLSSGGGYKKKGVVYKVYTKDKKKKVATLKTDKNGNTKKKRLKIGTYYFKEVSTGRSGYKRNKGWHKVIINTNETTVYTLKNEAKTGRLNLQLGIEVPEGSKASLSGYQFTIKNVKNGRKYTAKTNSKGVAKFKNVIAGTYKVTETLTQKQKDSYIFIKTKPYKIRIRKKETRKCSFKNILKPPEPPPDPPDNTEVPDEAQEALPD